MVSDPDAAQPVFDQDADASPAPRGGLVASIVAMAVVVSGAFFLAVRPGAGSPSNPTDLAAAAAAAVTTGSNDSVATVPSSVPAVTGETTIALPSTTSTPTTTPPATTPPASTAPPTTSTPTTAPATTPPTTAPADTAPPTTVAPEPLPLWALPPIPDEAPPDGPGSPQIRAEVLASGVRAVDVEPFLLRTQLLADAWADGDFELARTIDLRARAGPEYEARFADLDRSSLILVDAGVAGGSYELLVLEVNVESGATTTQLHCAQYAADGTTGNVARRGGFDLGMWDRNITPEEIRHAGDVFDSLVERCSFGDIAGQR